MKAVFLLLFLMLAVACQADEDIAVPESIQNVRTKHENRIMATPGVVSIGIGQDSKGQSAIVIGVESQEQLDKMSLPAELDGYPVKVEIMGTIRAQ